MREYEFRGYAVEEMVNSQWLYGYGVTKINYTDGTSSVHLLTQHGDYQVEEESVGQYIGLKDKNGVKIYEGDIVLRKQYIDYVDNCHVPEIKGIIKMYYYAWCAIRQCDNKTYTTPLFIEEEFGALDKIEVIGNTYENSNFLED